MYGLTRFNNSLPADPFSEFARDLFSFTPVVARAANAWHTARFDFVEKAEGYELRGDLPGVSQDNLEITVHEGILEVRGTRNEEKVTEDSKFVVRERSHGEFSRQLRLPKDADADKIQAKLEHGVLAVTIAKRKQEVPQARKITVG